MKAFIRLTFIIFMFNMLSSCSSTRITYDKNVDFTQYKTFAFYKKGIDALQIPANQKRSILKAITEVMEQKGFRKSAHPDILINVFTDIHKRIDVYPGYYTPYYRRSYVEKSKEGTVYIDIVDMKLKKPVWTASRYINYYNNDLKVIKKAVYKLLENFPPKH